MFPVYRRNAVLARTLLNDHAALHQYCRTPTAWISLALLTNFDSVLENFGFIYIQLHISLMLEIYTFFLVIVLKTANADVL